MLCKHATENRAPYDKGIQIHEYNTCRDPMGGPLDMDVEDMLEPEDYTIIPKDGPERPLPLRQRKEVQEVLRRKSVRFYRRRPGLQGDAYHDRVRKGDIAEA